MKICPHCGAENMPTRVACRSCWAPLPATEAPPPPRPAETPAPAPPVPAAPAPVAVPAADPSPPGATFAYVAVSPAERETRRVTRRLHLLAFAVCGVLGFALLWYVTFGSRPRYGEATETVTHYLEALTGYDIPQRWATEDSKNVTLPVWCGVAAATAQGVAEVQGARATMCIRLTLVPQQEALRSPTVRKALSRGYTLTIRLQREAAGWRVDQASVREAVRGTLARENPGVVFPAWE